MAIDNFVITPNPSLNHHNKNLRLKYIPEVMRTLIF